MNKKFSTKRMVRCAVIASIYCTLTILLKPISYGAVQFRVAEALTILPLFFPESIIGLTIGCFIANLFGNGVLDIVFGTLATLVSALLTYIIGRVIKNDLKLIGILPPILINAFVVPFTFLAVFELKELYWISALTVGLGQAVVIIVLGIPLYFTIKKLNKNSNLFFI